MPRTGVTFDQVAVIADVMVAEGVTPTIKKVRERLGDTGSHNTIHRHLAAWGEVHPPCAVASFDANSKAILTVLDQARSAGRAEVEGRLVLAQAEARELAEHGEVLESELSRCADELLSTSVERDTLRIKNAEQNAEIARVSAENGRERFATELARTEVAQLRNKLEMQAERQDELVGLVESLRRENAAEAHDRINAEKDAAVFSAKLQAEQEKANSLALEKENQSTQLVTMLQAAEEDRIKVVKVAAELEFLTAALKEKAEEIEELKVQLEYERVAHCRSEARLSVLAAHPIEQANLGQRLPNSQESQIVQ